MTSSWRGPTGHRWFPLTKNKWYGKHFHVINSWWADTLVYRSHWRLRHTYNRQWVRGCHVILLSCNIRSKVATGGNKHIELLDINYYYCIATYCRADSRFAPSQWETPLLCNGVSHWLGTSPVLNLKGGISNCRSRICGGLKLGHRCACRCPGT